MYILNSPCPSITNRAIFVLMLRSIAEALDCWIAEQNLEARQAGYALIPACTIRVLGQTALMEAGVALSLTSTKDVDVRADYVYSVQREFNRLLAMVGRALDPVGHEAWMPRETRYQPLFKGRYVTVLVAEPESVLLSKALKAPDKNRVLITEYLALGASERFLALAEKYSLDIEAFV